MNHIKSLISSTVSNLSVKQETLFLFLIVGIGFVLRIKLLFSTVLFPRDSLVYLDILHDYLNTNFYPLELNGETNGVLPFFPFMMKAIYLCGVSGYYSGIIISFISGICTIVFCWAISQSLWPERPWVALATAWFVAIHSEMIEYSVVVLRESLFLMLCSLSVLLWLHTHMGHGKKYLLSAVSGICWGLAIMTRYEGLELLLMIPAVWVWAKLYQAPRHGWLTECENIFVFLISTCIIWGVFLLTRQISKDFLFFYFRHLMGFISS